MLNCRICIHREVCKYVDFKLENLKVKGIPEVFVISDVKCRQFKQIHRRSWIPPKVIDYVNTVGIENYDQAKAIEHFLSLKYTKRTALEYARYANKYIREIKKEREVQEIDEAMKKLREQELMLKREIK